MQNAFPTLDQIRDLIREEGKIIIAAFDKDFKYLEGGINTLDGKIGGFKTEVYKRFDKVEDKLQSIDERLIVQSERVKKLEKQCFAFP